jgi:hypothetical protein
LRIGEYDAILDIFRLHLDHCIAADVHDIDLAGRTRERSLANEPEGLIPIGIGRWHQPG